MSADPEKLLTALLDKAKAQGADAADALLYKSLSSNVSVRLGETEEVERSENQDLGLRVFIGDKQASVSSTNFREDALDTLVERVVQMARLAPSDPYAGLAPEDRLAKPPFPDLDLSDGYEPTTEELTERAKACEDAARAVEGVTNSSGAGASVSAGESFFATSHGFFGRKHGGSHSVGVSVLAGEGTAMERDYESDAAVHLSDLRDPRDVGREAGERTVRRLNPRKMKSQQAPVIFEQRLAASLLGPLASAANGAAIARRTSFLLDKLGERLFPETIIVRDDPLRKRGFGSKPFDGEGVTCEPFDLIDKGVLTQWYLNSAQARQLGLETNGRARRGTGGAPSSGPSNLDLLPGTKSPEELIRDAGNGLLVTDMFGPQINGNTGDYSVGCSGFAIENGEIAYPVSEITIAGNLLDMWGSITAGNDLKRKGSVNAPTLLIERMTIAGN
ncbi:TldD/PmbA family protein [Parvularcula lutaonensis]|uniref:TldD/PmbA family protein n=1 Tax=Parvularcula lutaonensis TaxID=491923 RepID=A0ABV7ME94_9PROT|nr:TldD/PmbA family protein [Parvularcula lutaonensis]GGY54864.1 modulator protein [Parvularcula lutaonensis]